MKAGIIVCTRLDSTRLPNKCAMKINGKPILEHLHDRLIKTDLPIVYAYPEKEADEYGKLLSSFKNKGYLEYRGEGDNPLLRMYNAAKAHGIDVIVRHTHDKVFIDHEMIKQAVKKITDKGVEYLSLKNSIDGMGFEVIRISALERALNQYPDQNIEHITYAIRATCISRTEIDLTESYNPDVRLLIDYPEDIEFYTAMFSSFGNDISVHSLLDQLNTSKWLTDINKMPLVTIYTCAYNTANTIQQTMESVEAQSIFKRCEYILIDDHSTDTTSIQMAKFAAERDNVRYIRNNENLGLSSSSNIGLARARGKYIIRIDADDYFTSDRSIEVMYDYIKRIGSDALYPNNYLGHFAVIQSGKEEHHIGGTMFKKSALDHIRFTEGLRNYEGLSVWLRAKDILNVSYYEHPIFFYRQSENSMSKTNMDEREITRIGLINEHSKLARDRHY